MDIYELRDEILNKQINMLEGKEEKDDAFLNIINFENWCVNGGLSGFAQNYSKVNVDYIKAFAKEHNFNIVTKMVLLLDKFAEKYGKDFIDELNDDEYDSLCQYDDEFYNFVDQYTEETYNNFVKDMV